MHNVVPADTDPKTARALQEFISQNPGSKIIYQQSINPNALNKGLRTFPVIALAVFVIPFLFMAGFLAIFFSTTRSQFGLFPQTFPLLGFIMLVPTIMVVAVLIFWVAFRKMSSEIRHPRTYAIVEDKSRFVLLNLSNGSFAESPKQIHKSSITKFSYREVPVYRSRFGNISRVGGCYDHYAQILLEYNEEVPRVEVFAQEPVYNASKLLSMKKYLEKNGFSFEGERACPACKTPAMEEARFCDNCGFAFERN